VNEATSLFFRKVTKTGHSKRVWNYEGLVIVRLNFWNVRQ